MKSIIKLLFIFCILFFSKIPIFSQSVFNRGEKLFYTVEYQLGPFWKSVGTVSFTVDTIKNYQHKKIYHFISYGRSFSFYDWFFKVRDLIYSYATEDNLYSVYSVSKFHEGKLKVFDTYRFDNNKKVYCNINRTDTIPYRDTLFLKKIYRDPLTSAYYLRNKLKNFRLKKNEKIQLPMVITGKLYDLYVRYLGEETITFYGKTYKTYKFSAKVISGTIFSGGENFFVWVSRDEKKIPVKITAKILVGSVNVYLEKVKW